MIEYIKQIGLFMIVAQTLLHFAAGRSYEKYIKIITGIIILLLFVRPFSSELGNTRERLQEEMERMTEQIENHSGMWQGLSGMEYGAADKAIQQLEEEVRRKLNQEVVTGDFEVTDVSFQWEGDAESLAEEQTALAVTGIKICLRRKLQQDPTGSAGIRHVHIEPVSVSDMLEEERREEEKEGTEELDGMTQEYRSRFAESLGVEEEQVEVVYDGRR